MVNIIPNLKTLLKLKLEPVHPFLLNIKTKVNQLLNVLKQIIFVFKLSLKMLTLFKTGIFLIYPKDNFELF